MKPDNITKRATLNRDHLKSLNTVKTLKAL